MRRFFSCLLLSSLSLSACISQPGISPRGNAIQAQNQLAQSANSIPTTFTEQQYLDLSTQTILDELKQGSEASLQAYLDWGRTQPEYFKGSRNTIGQRLVQTLRGQSRLNRVAEIEALIKSPAQAVRPEAYQPIDFTRDHGVHKNKLAEWWYYTGHLYTPENRPYGYEICYFRVAPVINFAHLAVTDEKNQTFTYERNFYKPSQVSFNPEKANVRYGNLVTEQTGPFAFNLSFPVGGGKYKVNLNMVAEKQPLIINGDGLIDMPEGLDSYYYSLTKLKTSGTLEIDGKAVPVTGQSWMDHQWGHFVALRIGWDWFSFQMEDGSEYNLFGFRKRNGQRLERYVNAWSGSKALHSKDFKIERLEWWKSPKTGRNYVTKWRVTLPQTKEVFEVQAVQVDQEVAATKIYDIAPTYWEGRCKITKIKADGTRVNGLGYTEHFDYTQQIGAD